MSQKTVSLEVVSQKAQQNGWNVHESNQEERIKLPICNIRKKLNNIIYVRNNIIIENVFYLNLYINTF